MTDSHNGDRPPVIEELDGLAIGPAPVGEILHTARRDRRRRRTVLASVAAVSALLVGGGVVTTQVVGKNGDGRMVAETAETTPPTSPPTSSVQNPSLSSCALTYPDRLADQAFALDATVVDIAEDGSGVTLRVNQWFKGGDEQSLVLNLGGFGGTDDPTSEFSSGYSIGSRLLISGQRAKDGSRLVWNCGYTRTWNETEAASWDTAFGAERLTVTVETYTPEPSLSGIASGLARWNPETQVLDYISRLGYSGTCPPEGRVSADGEALNLTLTAITDRECTSDPPRMLVTITGLTKAPTEFTVTEDGETRTVPVASAATESGEAPDPATADIEFNCSQRSGATLDIFPPSNRAEARQYAQSPYEAARDVQMSPAYGPALGGGLLQEQSVAKGRTEYVVLKDGDLIGRLTVRPLGFGAYAVLTVEACSP